MRSLRAGEKLLLMGFDTTASSDDEKVLFSYVVSKAKAKKIWKQQWTAEDVWYYFPNSEEVYSMVGSKEKLMWKTIIAFKESEREKVRLFMEM